MPRTEVDKRNGQIRSREPATSTGLDRPPQLLPRSFPGSSSLSPLPPTQPQDNSQYATLYNSHDVTVGLGEEGFFGLGNVSKPRSREAPHSPPLLPPQPPLPKKLTTGTNISTEKAYGNCSKVFKPTRNRSNSTACDQRTAINEDREVIVDGDGILSSQGQYQTAVGRNTSALDNVDPGDYSTINISERNSTRKSRWKKLTVRLCTSILLVAISVTLSSVSVLYLFPLYYEVNNVFDPQHSDCVPCSHRSSADRARVRCCSMNSPPSNVMADGQSLQLQGLPGSTGAVQCAAHVFKRSSENSRCKQLEVSGGRDSVFQTIDGWDNSGDNAFVIVQCINVTGNGSTFTVNRSGDYIIYSHLAFSGPILHEANYGQLIYVNKHDKPVLGDYQTLSPNSKYNPGAPVHNSVVMATLRLRAGETLWVKAQPAECLFTHNGMSYFGFYLQRPNR